MDEIASLRSQRDNVDVIARSVATKQSKPFRHDMNQYWVYIMTNMGNTVLYTGVTSNFRKRILEHRDKKGSKFTSRYNITKLVYCEGFNRVQDAIAAEKRIKAGSRAKKIQLIESVNPQWKDLYERAFG